MKIESVKFSDHFKEEVRKAVRLMMENKEESKLLNNMLGGFIVSTNQSFSGRLFHVFSGEDLGISKIKEVYIFKK
jgi:hypothetical protein